MTERFVAGDFLIEYIKSRNDAPVVWEKHCHTQYELISVLEGDITLMLEGRSYRIRTGQAVIVPPLFYHAVTANQKGLYRRVTALFTLAAVPEVLQPHFQNKDAALAVFRGEQSEELGMLCRERDKLFYAPLGESLMIRLLYGDVQAGQNDTVAETDEFLRQVISYIDAHLCERITLEELAVYTSRSKSSVSHLFEEKMNITPKQYILQKKLALAHKMIEDGATPTATAMQVGYENYSNFYRVYRKLFHTSPSGRAVEKSK